MTTNIDALAVLREAYVTYMAAPTVRNYDAMLDAIPSALDGGTERAAIQPAGEVLTDPVFLREWSTAKSEHYNGVHPHQARYWMERGIALASPISEATAPQVPCALRGGKCNCPTACQMNMDAARTPAIVGSIANGYENGTCISNQEGGATIRLHYKTVEQAEAAFDTIIQDARATKMEAAPTEASK